MAQWTRVREVLSLNAGTDQFFRGFPESSRHMLSWITITMIHLTIIHYSYKSQNKINELNKDTSITYIHSFIIVV